MDYNKKTTQSYEDNFESYASKKAGTDKDSYHYLEKFSSYLKGKKILEIGFGLGYDAQWFAENGYEYIGVDPVSKFHDALKTNLPAVNLFTDDIRKIEFPKESFDGIWAMASLLHFNDQDIKKILKNCYKWLKPDGILFVSVKEGNGEIVRDDNRYFNLLTNEKFLNLVGNKFKPLQVENSNARKHNIGQENWLSFYLQKV